VVRACSEALYFGWQACFGDLFKNANSKYDTKLLFTVLNGGKSNGSNVKVIGGS